MLTLKETLTLKQTLTTLKLSNRALASYFDVTPTTMSKNKLKHTLETWVKLELIFGNLTDYVHYKEWGESKEARSKPLEEGTYQKINVVTGAKEPVSFEELKLDGQELEILRKTGVLWLIERIHDD